MNLAQTDQVTIKQEETERPQSNGPFQMRAAISESGINDDDYMDEIWMRRHAPSSGRLDDTGLDEENDPKIKQEDCDGEHDVQSASSEEEEDVKIKQEDYDAEYDILYACSEEEDVKIKQEDCDAEHDVQYASGEEEDDVEIKQEDTNDDWYTKRDLLAQDFERDTLNA